MDTSSEVETSKNQTLGIRFKILVCVVGAIALMRLLPHPPNFTPVAAVALFGGAYFDRKYWAFLVPLAAMLLSDIGLELLSGYGFHSLMPVIYGLFAATVCIGFWLRRNVTILRVGGAAIGSSLLFFLGSNFAVWGLGTRYAPTFDGLIACYVAAIPFYQNTLMGTLAYSALIFGGWAIAQNKYPVLALPETRRLAV